MGERKEGRIVVLKQKYGSSMLEVSERHVSEMGECVFGVAGASLPWEVASRRGCLLGRKGKV